MKQRTLRRFALTLLLSGLSVSLACSTARPLELPTSQKVDSGMASWYGPGFHGKRTASGERYDMHEFTAAHRTLPFGTMVEVRNRETGATVVVTITDRGPFVRGRVLDVSKAAAKALGLIGPGSALVDLFLLSSPAPPRFVVQVGAFREEQHARALEARLAGRFQAVRVEASEGWHRVQVGDGLSRDEAELLLSVMLSEDLPAVLVTQSPRATQPVVGSSP